jgi:predicted amidophosphoribosyltransferase
VSEICLDCWNKLNETKDPARKYILTWRKELCEDCGQMKRVIIRMRLPYIYLDLAREMIENVRYALRERKK